MYFLHKRSAANEQWIVAVHGFRYIDHPAKTDPPDWVPLHTLSLNYEVLSLGTWTQEPRAKGTNGGISFALGNGRNVKVFNGTPDPNDPSRFTITYDVDGSRGTIDGWLEAPDSLRMRVRDGPAAPYNSEEWWPRE